jgi:hypothetical protein
MSEGIFIQWPEGVQHEIHAGAMFTKLVTPLQSCIVMSVVG